MIDNTDDCLGKVNPVRYIVINIIVLLFTNSYRIDYNHTAFESFLLSGIGILIFIAFGSDKQIYFQWIKIS